MYTDRFARPLNVGDKVVVPAKTRYAGKGPSTLRESTVLAIIPLVPHRTKNAPKMERIFKRDDPNKSWGPGKWIETGKVEGHFYMREDQDGSPSPTAFFRSASTPPDKLFVIQYEWPLGSGRKQAFDRADDVIKVPDGV
jgi:hypothetical protein